MAQVVRIAPEVPAAYAEAVERYLGSASVGESSRRVYRISLTTWAWLLAGEQPPARRRGARPPHLLLAALDDPGLPPRLATSFAARAAGADTVNRELSVLRAAVSWWQAQGWVAGDPSRGLSRPPAPPDRTRALSRDEVDAVLRLDVAPREKTYWRLLHESAARADEVLTLDVGDLDPRNKRARVVVNPDLTHEAGDGASTPMLLARSRHASVRSLERYARPGVDAVGAYVARRDPAARRRHPGSGPVPEAPQRRRLVRADFHGYAFIPLLDEPEASQCVELLTSRLSASSATPASCVKPPLRGLAFITTEGADSDLLDPWWNHAVPADRLPVLITFHEPGLERWMAEVDAEAVIGVASLAELDLYAGMANVLRVLHRDFRVLAAVVTQTYGECFIAPTTWVTHWSTRHSSLCWPGPNPVTPAR